MRNTVVYASTITFMAAFSGLVYGGCGYYENAYNEAVKNAAEKCDPNTDACPSCSINDDCPGDKCNDAYCDTSGACQRSAKPDGTEISSGECEKTDCQGGKTNLVRQEQGQHCFKTTANVCTQNGRCIECISNSDCTSNASKKHCENEICVECRTLSDCASDGSYCLNGACVPLGAIDATCSNDDHCQSGLCLAGKCAECTAGDTSRCGSGGQWRCLDGHCASCSNNMPDSDEDGVDCGGVCPKRCNGIFCVDNNSCKSGNCVDNTCCETSDCPECHDCNVLPFVGTCQPVPAGDNDDCPGDGNGMTISGCSAMHECKLEGGNGDYCAGLPPEFCLSGKCNGLLCTSP